MQIEDHPDLKRTTTVELNALDIINLMALLQTDLMTTNYDDPQMPRGLKEQMQSAQNKLRAGLAILQVTP